MLLFISIVLATAAWGETAPDIQLVHGPDILSGKEVHVSQAGHKGEVVIFLSATCPCSDSHMQEIASLAKQYPDFEFIGVHSNTDEAKEPTKNYFTRGKLPFPVIQDNGAKIADAFKAYKTPHVFVRLADGSLAYQGGVSSSHDFAKAEHQYLREALEDISNKRPVRTERGRTLGCVISRGEKNAW